MNTMREQFEEWATSRFKDAAPSMNYRDGLGGYSWHILRYAWEAWQAALAAQPATVPEGWRVEIDNLSCGDVCAIVVYDKDGCGQATYASSDPILTNFLVTLAAAPKPEQQETPERECRHCGFLCRPNPAKSGWKPLEQQEASEEIHPELIALAGGLKITTEQMQRDMANAPIYHQQEAHGCEVGATLTVCDDCEHWKPVRMRGES